MKGSALALLLLLSNSRVASAMTTEACIDAHVAAQKLRAESKLLESRDALAQCGAAECPGVLRGECGAWLLEVSQDIPSLVPVVVSSDGADVSAAKVSIDGTSRTVQPGVSLEVDPGPHELRVVADGFEAKALSFTANAGVRDRRLEITLVPLGRPEVVSQEPAVWPYFALGGGVVLGVGAFAGFGSLARADERDLGDCKPNCSDSAIDKVKSEYLAANIGLAVAGASLAGAGAYFLFTRSSISVRSETTGSMVYYSRQF